MQQLTFTEENYLKNIYSLQHENENGEVSVNEISERMQTKPATVTDMLRKLSEKSLIHYKRYKKIRLAEAGVSQALQIIRKHRLWETFLHDKLHFSWDEVHEVAEQMEHIHSQKLIDRLDGYLDYPQFDPHGDPIPDSDGKLPSTSNLLLCDTEVNNTYIITAVRDTTSSFLQQLERFGLQIGKSITTIEVMAYDNSILIEVEEAPSILVSEKIARNLIVSAVAR